MNVAAAVSLFATATGLVFGVIWWRVSKAPGWQSMRWFAAVSITAAGYCAFDTLSFFELDPWAIQWATQMAFTISSLHAASWILWLAESVPRKLDRFDKFVLGLALLTAAAGFVPGLLVSNRYDTITVEAIGVTYHVFIPTGLGLVGYLVFLVAMWGVAARSMARWSHGWRARFPALAVAILTLIAVNDSLATAKVIHMPMLSDIGFLIVVLIFGIDSLRRFAADAERLEVLTHRLEHAVAERTRRLEVTQLELAKERTVAAVGRLAGGVAHQINSPATVISVNLGLLRDELAEQGRLDGTMTDLLDESRASLDRILGIVTDLRLSAGAIETRGALVHTAGLRTCVEAAVERAAQRGLRADRTEVHVAPDLHVEGDRDLVTQLLTELVANAVAAAAAANAAGSRVAVTARVADERVDVDVSDNGAGVPDAIRAAMFEPFAGEHGVAQRRGLGLAVVRGLAEQLRATLYLVATSEHGTTFRVGLRAVADRGA